MARKTLFKLKNYPKTRFEEGQTTHVLKSVPHAYSAVEAGEKTFEIRHNDRGFKKGDNVELLEYYPDKERYTGNGILVEITHLSTFEQKGNMIVFSFRIIEEFEITTEI